MAFAFRRTATVDHTQCGSADDSNYPVLVSFTSAAFKVIGSGGHVQNSSGFDICFYSDVAGTTPLFWEMEKYVSTTGEVVAWVKLPTVSHTADTVFYVFYGNSAISTFQSTISSTWPAQYKSVYHQASLTADSTVDANTLVNTAVTSGTGKIDGCGSYNGSAMQLCASPTGIPVKTYPIVLEAWINPSSLPGNQYVMMASQYQSTFGNLFNMALDVSGNVYVYNGSIHQVASGAPAISTGVWTHVIVDIQSTILAVIYINGTAYNCTLDGSPVTDYGNPEVTIGDQDVAGLAPFNGLIDENRISTTSPSQSWVTKTYNNAINPGTFVTLGSEVTIGGLFRPGSLSGLGSGGPFFQSPLN